MSINLYLKFLLNMLMKQKMNLFISLNTKVNINFLVVMN